MNIIEFYSDDILDLIDLGVVRSSFDEEKGDYIKIELKDIESDKILYNFYSNRLLFEYEFGGYYFGDYHYNNEINKYIEGMEHTDELQNILLPVGNAVKQFNIYRDENLQQSNHIYIKPNEFLKNINLKENKYKLRLYFLRDIKSLISRYLQLPKTTELEPTPKKKKTDMKLIPIYRFWNEEKQKHHYTTDQKEYENLISNPNYKKWKFERIEGYIPDINNKGNNT